MEPIEPMSVNGFIVPAFKITNDSALWIDDVSFYWTVPKMVTKPPSLGSVTDLEVGGFNRIAKTIEAASSVTAACPINRAFKIPFETMCLDVTIRYQPAFTFWHRSKHRSFACDSAFHCAPDVLVACPN